jgi:tetrahydromethanopterin:alpha-L-glutamate ligase
MNRKIGVIGIPGRWSSETLADTVAAKTGFRLLISMDEVSADLHTGKVWFREHDLTALDALMIKKLASDYEPEMMNRLEILRFLETRGVPIFSRPERIAGVLNRLHCTTSLRLGNLPIPPTVITENIDEACRAVDDFGAAIFKPLFTSKARGMIKVDSGPEAMAQIRSFQNEGNRTLYIQKYCPLPDRDLGLVFLGGRYLATYARVRQNGAWNTTIQAGGRYEPAYPDRPIIKLAYKAQALFGLTFTCVDLAETEQGPIIFEVSAFGGFRGLKAAHNIDAADALVDFVLNHPRRK